MYARCQACRSLQDSVPECYARCHAFMHPATAAQERIGCQDLRNWTHRRATSWAPGLLHPAMRLSGTGTNWTKSAGRSAVFASNRDGTLEARSLDCPNWRDVMPESPIPPIVQVNQDSEFDGQRTAQPRNRAPSPIGAVRTDVASLMPICSRWNEQGTGF